MLAPPPGLFEVATRLFVLVGLTLTKLSAWLPVVALTFTTGSTQTSGTNKSVGFGVRSWGFMHLRVPSGTSVPPVGASSWAYKTDVAGVSNAKTAARVVRWRRVFICGFLLMRRVRSGLKTTHKRRDSSTISKRMSSLILILAPNRRDERKIKSNLRHKLLLTIDAHSDGVKR